MEQSPHSHPVEPTIRAAIGDEVARALKKLGAEMPHAGGNEPDDLYDALRKHGAKSELLGIIRHWRDKGDDQWALNELRRWNTRDPRKSQD
ncbi:hypothetical protein SAZ10_32650 [Mesorhizobium sp. BAC0120]|uniref:hypothetical protein n=1 Tax=Mesorhizobium sp. BAC0120 TaxID=3090670 RepID=UPI00298C6865|nr:hypothetical protein [Mesorhizobium sp. BAC0120]MDW6026521.1 hypothetical protein [Mesorhizobium sp. BAC0120]